MNSMGKMKKLKQAFENGEQIEINLGSRFFPRWVVFCKPKWNMPIWRYRIKKN